MKEQFVLTRHYPGDRSRLAYWNPALPSKRLGPWRRDRELALPLDVEELRRALPHALKAGPGFYVAWKLDVDEEDRPIWRHVETWMIAPPGDESKVEPWIKTRPKT